MSAYGPDASRWALSRFGELASAYRSAVPNRRKRRPTPDRFALAEAKRRAGLTVSVCLPARDEEATVGSIVAGVRRGLMGRIPLVDEIVVLDDRSRDRTARAAARA